MQPPQPARQCNQLVFIRTLLCSGHSLVIVVGGRKHIKQILQDFGQVPVLKPEQMKS